MKGISLDFHSWRGFFFWPHEPDLFHFRVTAGFVTLWVCKFCVHERFNAVTRLVTGRGARLAAAIHDAARLALAVQASGVVIAPCVPRGEAGRRDLVTIGAYCEMAFARNAAERELAIWRETCAVPLVLPSPPSPQRGEGWGEGASEEEFGAEMLEAAER